MTSPKSQHIKRNELWCSINRPFDFSQDSGTHEVLAFAESIYTALLNIEHTILQANSTLPGICGLRVFCRLDIGVIWDDRDEDERKHQYRLILNEIQPGDVGLFITGHQGSTDVLEGFVEGIERGSLQT